MRYQNLFLLFYLLYYSLSFAQQKDTIYGSVKSVREQLIFLDKNHQNKKLYSSEGEYGHHGFHSSRATKSRFHYWWYNTPWVHYSNYFKTFNKKGKPVSEIWFYKNGDTVRSYTYQYDKNDNLIQERNIYDKDSYTCVNFSYDHKHKIMSILYYVSDDPNIYSYTTYKHDSALNLVAIRQSHGDGKLSAWEFKYDSKNRKVSKSRYDEPYAYVKKGESTSSKHDSIGLYKICEKYFYDSNDNLIETQYYNCDEDDNLPAKLRRKIKNKYHNNLLLKRINIDHETIINYIAYDYDDLNRKIKESFVYPKNVNDSHYKEYYYNKNNNIIKLIYTENNKTNVIEFEYEFDEKNNWTKQVKSINGKKLFVWTRDIKYFE